MREKGADMDSYDWNEIVGRLTKYLRVDETPVGIKYFETKAEILQIPKVRIPKKRFSPCTTITQAVKFNWTVACFAETVHINYCRGIHGMTERDEKWFSGGIFENVWFEKLEDSAAHNKCLACLPAQYAGLVAFPLASGQPIDPDVCVLYVDPARAFLLLAGWQYYGYEKLVFTFAGESTCSDSWLSTMLTGKPKLSIPSYADRKWGSLKDEEVIVSMKPADLLRAVNGLEHLSKNGLRYPIAPYSLTCDMMEGLPKSYLEY